MKLNSEQFKRKLAYFKPFIGAIILHQFNSNAPLFEMSVLFMDSSKYRCFTSYPICSSYPSDIKRVDFVRLDECSFNTERQFFYTFLVSCNNRQLFTALDTFKADFAVNDNVFWPQFLSIVSSMVGDSKISAYVSRKS